MEYVSLAAIRKDLDRGSITIQKLVENYIYRINTYSDLNAFIEVFSDEALEKAAVVQTKFDQGTAGRLAGLIIGIKDNICYAGHTVSAGSKILEKYVSIYSSTVVERLLAEDAIIIGRLNCDEFGMGASNENSWHGPVRNFADRTRVSGGSSGGSAVAVQAGLCLAALGTDTGGSVRQPAAFCGVIGFKPSYGRISRHGILAYGSSFDQVGTITRSVEDASLLLEIVAGADERDSTASCSLVPHYTGKEYTSKSRIAYFKEVLEAEALDAGIKVTLETVIDQLRKEGHTVEEVSFKYLEYLVPTYYILTMAEASSNLARYDGVHYGYRCEGATDLESTYKLSRSKGFGAEVKRRIMMGSFVLSAGYYDAYYAKAQKVRRLIAEKTKELLTEYDFILMPTTPEPAFLLGKEENDPIVSYLGDIFTVLASLAGLPAISIPVGNNENGLPLGLQLIGKSFEEEQLLSFSKYFSQMVNLTNLNT
ncbi:MAG TPA: Asp-tRNA(Asn)/Glu-tRNA(Gln) amidotransferase subunit GatA [Sphingobacteriaceae bacterium]|nr:Asp-tRNA(Asn)/Glu-tRNA(Gln) amidotransferase subunit GatA [Sphingobacteriaceae bacterium]